jgi:hypothetical protein
MSTEFDRGSKASGFARFLRGSIEAGELNRALVDERPPATGVYASPAKKVQGTQTKTCKPTRNPCCKGAEKLEATKAKTCKPTRNPCCKGADKVEGTQTKTCKPTRNPCCKPVAKKAPAKKAPAKKRADGRHDDFLGGATVERLFI